MGEDGKKPEGNEPASPLEYAGPGCVTQIPRPPGRAGLLASMIFLGLVMLCGTACGPMAPERFWTGLAVWYLCAVLAEILAGRVGWSMGLPVRSDRPRPMVRAAAVTALCTFVGICGLVVMFMGGAAGVTNAIARDHCYSKVLRMNALLGQYANGHGGKYPPSLGELIKSGYIEPRDFVCSMSDDQAAQGATTQQAIDELAKPGRCSYVYLGAGLRTTAPAGTVLVYEKQGHHDRGGIWVLFADERVEWFKGTLATQLVQELNAGKNPPPCLGAPPGAATTQGGR